MVRGCQKRTVHIRDTGSKYYEEAFFILRPGALDSNAQSDMIEEAMRIAEETLNSAVPEKKRKKKNTRDLLIFASGFISGALAAAAVLLIVLL